MRKTLIAAVSTNGVIGLDGGIPWKHREDVNFFKTFTMGKAVIMGRKTYESLPVGGLAGRMNICVT